MTETPIDLESWPRAGAYRLFRGYERPHFSLTARLDVTRIVARKAAGVSSFRACLFALAAGVNAVPELRTRFRADGTVVEHDRVRLSPTIALPDGTFGFGYIDFRPDWPAFDAAARAEIEAVRGGADRLPNPDGRDDLMYLSCLPWIDFTAMTNAVRDRDDCIPRLSWGRFVEGPDSRTTCAAAVEVHHAIADGAHVARMVAVAQDTLDAL